MNKPDSIEEAILYAEASKEEKPISNLHIFAESELRAAGYFNFDNGMYGDMLGKSTLELIDVFAAQGHSGMSASIASNLFNKLSRFEPLSPLTGEDDEWNECAPGMWQNKRCSHVFKQTDRYDGMPYDIEGKIFREPNGACYTNGDSHIVITFPYTPKFEYVDVEAYQDE
jgi:hypothetical protein